MSPAQQILRQALVDQLFLRKEAYDGFSKTLCHLLKAAQGDMYEPTLFVKASFQDESMEVGIPS